MYVYLTE